MNKNMVIIFVALLASGVIFGCGEASQALHTDEISGCGGFTEAGPSTFKSSDDESDCRAMQNCRESLAWTYDASSNTLSLLNQYVDLNCCGERSIQVFEKNGGYHILEVDASEGGARCSCMCQFDFKTDILNVTGKSVLLVVTREIFDDHYEGLTEIWNGPIDLTDGSGVLQITNNRF